MKTEAEQKPEPSRQSLVHLIRTAQLTVRAARNRRLPAVVRGHLLALED